MAPSSYLRENVVGPSPSTIAVQLHFNLTSTQIAFSSPSNSNSYDRLNVKKLASDTYGALNC